ncbi:MAG: hypothetical protein IJE26_01865 [Oscillospiraceae bacterium]|nr:hypothetical protein [Oscillospiraceae bacterium]
MKKLNYSRQLILTMAIVLVFNLLNTFLKHWVFTNIGYALCGLLWIIHPVMAGGREPTKKQLNIIRIAGGVFILMAIFTRSYLY